MATQTIKEYLVGLGFEVNEAQLEKFNSGLLKAGAGAVALGGIIQHAAEAAFEKIKEMINVKEYAEQLEKINVISGRTKISAENLMALGFAAGQNASSMEEMMTSLEGLTKTAGLAAMGMGRGQKVFEQLGISVKDGNGKLKDTVVLMDEIKDKIKDMDTGQQIAVISRLGMSAGSIKVMTEDMTEAMADYNHMLKQSGMNASEATEAANTYNDALGAMQTATGLLGQAAAARMFKPLTESTNKMRSMLVENMPKILDVIDKAIKVFFYLKEVVATVFARLFAILYEVVKWLGEVNKATDGWIWKIGALVVAWRTFNLAFLATPLGMVIALGAALGLLFEDFYVWRQGGDSLINWEKWKVQIDTVIDFLSSFGGAVASVFEVVSRGAGTFGEMVGHIFDGIVAIIHMFVDLLFGDFSGAWSEAKEVASQFGSALGVVFGQIGIAIRGVLDFIGVSGVLKTVFDINVAVIELFIGVLSRAFTWVGSVVTAVGSFIGQSAIFIGAWNSIGASVSNVITLFSTAFNWISKLVTSTASFLGMGDGIVSKLTTSVQSAAANTTAATGISKATGAAKNDTGPFGIGVPPTPAPSTAATLSPTTQTVSQKTEINVTGGSDPAATGKAVAGQQDRVNADMTRNLASRAR